MDAVDHVSVFHTPQQVHTCGGDSCAYFPHPHTSCIHRRDAPRALPAPGGGGGGGSGMLALPAPAPPPLGPPPPRHRPDHANGGGGGGHMGMPPLMPPPMGGGGGGGGHLGMVPPGGASMLSPAAFAAALLAQQQQQPQGGGGAGGGGGMPQLHGGFPPIAGGPQVGPQVAGYEATLLAARAAAAQQQQGSRGGDGGGRGQGGGGCMQQVHRKRRTLAGTFSPQLSHQQIGVTIACVTLWRNEPLPSGLTEAPCMESLSYSDVLHGGSELQECPVTRRASWEFPVSPWW
eukprot:365599-Chlamydomonas_euryale.AAC.4